MKITSKLAPSGMPSSEKPVAQPVTPTPATLSLAARRACGFEEPRVEVPDGAGQTVLELRANLAAAKVDGSGNLVVWRAENERASQGEVVSVAIEPAQASAGGLQGDGVRVSGRSTLVTAAGHQPFPDGQKVTADGFDQVQALWTADHILDRLRALGLDIGKLQHDDVNSGLLRIAVNDTTEMNAWYSPADNQLTFGTSDGKWHLASDTDVVAHEIGHYLLDHLNRDMALDGESGAVHEGFGDALAALVFNDPEIGEDFPAHGARENVFLRTVDNALRRSDVSTEVHDLGRVFGGYVWSVKTKLAALLGDDEDAAERMFAILVRHAFYYGTTLVTGGHFVSAMMTAARHYLAAEMRPAELQELMQFMRDEAGRRQLVSGRWREPELRPMALKTSVVELGRSLAAGRADVVFEPLATQELGELRKVTFRAMALDRATGERLPVVDGHVAVLIRGAEVVQIAGGGTALPKAFDFTRPAGGDQAIYSAALAASRAFIARQPVASAELSRRVQARLEGLSMAPPTGEWVLCRGKRALKLDVGVGELIVDVGSGEVTARRMARPG
jgi:hypothetical protein